MDVICRPLSHRIARLAQSVEHQTLNLVVVGSSPTLGASFCLVAVFGTPGEDCFSRLFSSVHAGSESSRESIGCLPTLSEWFCVNSAAKELQLLTIEPVVDLHGLPYL